MYIKQRYCQQNLLPFKRWCVCSRTDSCTLKAALQLCCSATVGVYRASVCMNTLKHTSHVHRAAAASRSFTCNQGGFNCRWIRHAFMFFMIFTEMLLYSILKLRFEVCGKYTFLSDGTLRLMLSAIRPISLWIDHSLCEGEHCGRRARAIVCF